MIHPHECVCLDNKLYVCICGCLLVYDIVYKYLEKEACTWFIDGNNGNNICDKLKGYKCGYQANAKKLFDRSDAVFYVLNAPQLQTDTALLILAYLYW